MEGGMLQQSRFWAIVALFATFAAGGLLGWAVGTRAHGGGPRGWESRGGGPPGPDGMVGFLSERLDLTAAQRDSVRAILERHRADLEKIWREVHPRFDSVRSRMSAEISAQLTPAQRTRYADLERRLDRPRFGGGPPWEGPRPRP